MVAALTRLHAAPTYLKARVVVSASFRLHRAVLAHICRPTPVAAVPQKTLKVVSAPLAIDAVPSAPPALEDRTPTVDYVCGRCGTVLMHADENKAQTLIIHCTVCDAYNSTDAEAP